MNNQEKNSNKGVKLVIVCGIITIAIIVLCVFFPEQIFGLFTK